MLHILLVILKILGIILACLLGLLLLLVLIVLFVPVRYRVDAKKREEIIIKMRVSWLARLVFVRVWFINKQLHIKLRILGFTFWDNLRPKKEKKVKKKVKKKNKTHKKEDKSKEKTPKTASVSLSKEQSELVVQPKKTLDDETVNEPDSDQIDKSIKSKTDEIENLPSRLEEIKKDSSENKNGSEDAEEQLADSTKKAEKKTAGKLKKLFAKFKGFFQKLSKLGSTIKEKWNKLLDLIKKIFDKKNLVSVFLKDELNQAGIKLALGQLLEVLKYCGPQKIEGYLKFGTGDPESTGKLLGAVAFLYGYYGKSVTIEPDFENKVFEAEGMVKGRIRIIRLLIIGIKVIRDKNFKKLVKNARQLKEEL